MNRILILGIGNLVQSDDGFGVHFIREIEKESLPENVRLIDAGTSIVDQLGDIVESDRLICVDVADGGEEPGTIYRFTPEDIGYRKSMFHHAHKITIFEVLDMANKIKSKPIDTTIIAVQPERIDWGTELTPLLASRLKDVIKIVKYEVSRT